MDNIWTWCRYSDFTWGGLIVYAIFLSLVCIPGGRDPRYDKRGMKVTRIILNILSVILASICILQLTSATKSVYLNEYTDAFALVAQSTRVISQLLWHSALVNILCLLIIIPSTRLHPRLGQSSIFFLITITLPITIIPPLWLFEAWPLMPTPHSPYSNALLPLLTCLIAAAVWFGNKFVAAYRQENDTRGKIIVGLVVFHAVSLGIYLHLIWTLCNRVTPMQ